MSASQEVQNESIVTQGKCLEQSLDLRSDSRLPAGRDGGAPTISNTRESNACCWWWGVPRRKW